MENHYGNSRSVINTGNFERTIISLQFAFQPSTPQQVEDTRHWRLRLKQQQQYENPTNESSATWTIMFQHSFQISKTPTRSATKRLEHVIYLSLTSPPIIHHCFVTPYYNRSLDNPTADMSTHRTRTRHSDDKIKHGPFQDLTNYWTSTRRTPA